MAATMVAGLLTLAFTPVWYRVTFVPRVSKLGLGLLDVFSAVRYACMRNERSASGRGLVNPDREGSGESG
jgi:hypothetical protein